MKFWMAFKLFYGNLQKSLFPLIAVVIGTMFLIIAISLGDGVRKVIMKDLSTISSNRILVGGAELTFKDLELLETLPFVEYALFPESNRLVKDILYKNYSKKALKTLNLPFLKEDEIILDKTQFLNKKIGAEVELETGLGKSRFIIRDLYEEESPLETMKIGNRVIINNKTFEKLFGKITYKTLVISFLQNEDGEKYVPVILRELNRYRPKYNQVKILETPSVYKKVERIKSFVEKGLFILSFISLILGGVGVLNLIATTIKDRISYIGLLRSIGMSKKMLVEIFCIEGLFIIFLGTTIGIILGIFFTYLIGYGLKISPHFNFVKILTILIITIIIELLIGILPARKAGKLKIVEMLKI